MAKSVTPIFFPLLLYKILLVVAYNLYDLPSVPSMPTFTPLTVVTFPFMTLSDVPFILSSTRHRKAAISALVTVFLGLNVPSV